MKYSEALAAIDAALTFGIDPSLEPIKAMCAAMGNPQQNYHCIQIAGTNGKTSTSRMSAALLKSLGYKTALYTSPHLVEYPERMEINGEVVGRQAFADAIEAALAAAKDVNVVATEFELLTAAAIWLFAREGVEYAVFECGLGGRWDATSVVTPDVAVITGIGLDHTAILGDTVELIAAEKAAIIKPESTAVLANAVVARDTIMERINEVDARYVDVPDGLDETLAPAVAHLPSFQKKNVATATTAVQQALGRELTVEQVVAALKDFDIPGRFEMLQQKPLLIIDAAHNPQSAQTLAAEVERVFPERSKRPVLLLGVLADKDAYGIVDALVPLFDKVAVTASESPRALSADMLAAIVEPVLGVRPVICPTVSDALKYLKDMPVIASGSITIAGEVKGLFQQR